MNNPFQEIAERLGRIENCLINIKQEVPPNELGDQWFDMAELCQYHPEKPARATVYTWVRERRIPYHKRGKKLAFLKSEIDQNIKDARTKSVSDIEMDADNYLANKKGGVNHGK